MGQDDSASRSLLGCLALMTASVFCCGGCMFMGVLVANSNAVIFQFRLNHYRSRRPRRGVRTLEEDGGVSGVEQAGRREATLILSANADSLVPKSFEEAKHGI